MQISKGWVLQVQQVNPPLNLKSPSRLPAIFLSTFSLLVNLFTSHWLLERVIVFAIKMQLSLIYNFKLTINIQSSVATFSNPMDRIISLASKHKLASIFHCFYPGSWYSGIVNHSLIFIQQISVYWRVSFSSACEVYYNSWTDFACCICG